MSDTDSAAAGEAIPPSPKRLKSQPPDVVVAVGQGDSEVEFECYGTLLSVASEVFDTMLSTNMKEKETRRIELPDKNPQEWGIFYDFVENRDAKVEATKRSGVGSSDILSETKERARLLLPWFHEFQMSALVKECDNALQKELPTFEGKGGDYFKKFWLRNDESQSHEMKRKEMFQLCHELLSMSCVYDLPKTQKHVARTLRYAINYGHDLFNVDILKTIIPLLKNSSNDKSRHPVLDELCECLPGELAENSDKCLAENDDDTLAYLIYAGIQEKSAKNELEEVKTELQRAINLLPNSLSYKLPDKKSMPTGSIDTIAYAARRELRKIIYDWWGEEGLVRNTIQVPPSYRYGG